MDINKSNCFEGLDMNCVCNKAQTGCFCSDLECGVRSYAFTDRELPTLTDHQKEFLKNEAIWAGEGLFKESDFQEITDKGLCLNVMEAWHEYAASNCY